MEQLTKKCTKCGRILPLNFFYKDKGCKYGVAGTCKECKKISVKAYREENKDKIAKYNNEYREVNKDKIAKYMRKYGIKYRESNKEKIDKYNKEYYEAKKHEIIERLREYNEENKEDYKARRKLGNAIRDGKITRPNKCDRCGKKCTPDGHHWNYAYPLNVVWLCRSCHKIVHLKFGCIHENINGEIN